MKKLLFLACLLTFCGTAKSQTVLAIDFNERVVDQTTNTANFYPGFDSFIINSNTSLTAVQSGNSTRTFAGGLTVTLAGIGTTATHDDRLRAVPANSGAFTQQAILRDFVFNGSANNGDGLSVTIDGLIADQFYKITIWSYDNSSTGNRVSDWTANGVTVKTNYIFNGSTLPTSDAQYQFNFKIAADGTGRIVVQGRRNAATSSAGAVFINAMQVEVTTANPDPPVIGTHPANSTNYAGDNAVFSAQVVSGDAPFSYQWFRDQTNLLADATNLTLVVTNVQLADAGTYTFVVSNVTASVTSAPASLVVFSVSNIASGLLVHWPLDSIVTLGGGQVVSVNADPSDNFLYATNMDASNITNGYRGGAAVFNGTDEFLTRTNGPQDTLPAYGYPAYSVTLWVKGKFQFTNESSLVVTQNDRRVFAEGSNLGNNPLLTIGTDNAGTNASVDIFIRNNNGGAPINHRKSTLPAFDGDWHHIAWVDNNGFAQLYVDGVQDTNNFNYTRGVLTANINSLGTVYRTNAQALFNGQIDEVAIYRRSLTSNEVNYVMLNGPVPPSTAAAFTFIGVASSNVTLRYVNPTGTYQFKIQETTELMKPFSESGWTDVTNAVLSVDGTTTTAQFPQTPGPQRFYRLASE